MITIETLDKTIQELNKSIPVEIKTYLDDCENPVIGTDVEMTEKNYQVDVAIPETKQWKKIIEYYKEEVEKHGCTEKMSESLKTPFFCITSSIDKDELRDLFKIEILKRMKLETTKENKKNIKKLSEKYKSTQRNIDNTQENFYRYLIARSLYSLHKQPTGADVYNAIFKTNGN